MLLITVPNSGNLTLPGAPKLIIPEYEKKILAIDTLAAVIDPVAAQSGGNLKSRFGNATLAMLGGTTAINSADLNNLPVFNISAAVARVTATGIVPSEYTVIFAIRPLTTGYMMGIGTHRMRLTSTTALVGQISSVAGNSITGTIPAALNTNCIFAMSWSSAEKVLAIFQGSTEIGRVTPSGADAATYPASLLYAYNSASDGMTALIGDMVILKNASHSDRVPLQKVVAAMAEKYAIAIT